MGRPVRFAKQKARETSEELKKTKNYLSTMDKDGTIRSVANPAKRVLRLVELARIANKRKQK